MSDFMSAMRARSKSMSTAGSRDSFLGPLFRGFRARHIDLFGAFRDLGQDRHAIGLDFGEAKRDGQVVLLVAVAVPISPAPSTASSGACPGRTPKYPSAPGISTSSTVSFTSIRSAETICSCSFVGSTGGPWPPYFSAPSPCDHIIDRARHVEVLLRNVVVLALDDFLEAADCVRDLHVLALSPVNCCATKNGCDRNF